MSPQKIREKKRLAQIERDILSGARSLEKTESCGKWYPNMMFIDEEELEFEEETMKHYVK